MQGESDGTQLNTNVTNDGLSIFIIQAICDAFEASELGDAVKAEIKQLESRESSRQLDERGHQVGLRLYIWCIV